MTLWPKPLLLAWGNGPPARAGMDGWTDGRTARLPSRPHAARPPPVYIPSVGPRPASRPCPLPSGCFLGPAKPLPASGTSRLPPPALRTPFRAGNTLLHGRPLAPFVQVSVRSVTAPERPLLAVTACKQHRPQPSRLLAQPQFILWHLLLPGITIRVYASGFYYMSLLLGCKFNQSFFYSPLNP